MLLFAFLLWALPAESSTLDLELRHGSLPTLENTVDQTAVYTAPVKPWLTVSGGARMVETVWSVQNVEYKLEAEAKALSFLSFHFRFNHASYLAEGVGSSTLSGWMDLKAQPFSSLDLFLNAGWYERLTDLSSTPMIPVFSPSLSEHDFLLGVGARVKVTEDLAVRGTLATFENLHTFNLNNPYAELRVSYRPASEPWTLSLMGRYRILLGFGRLDEMMVGAGIAIPLESSPRVDLESSPSPPPPSLGE